MIEPNIRRDGQTILVTGAAGFIGANLARGLIETEKGVTVIGFDNVNDYYDVGIKESRLREIEKTAAAHPANRWIFIRGDLSDASAVRNVFAEYRPGVVVNLAAQAGVRYSIDHPDAYLSSNVIGFYNILEACRRYPVSHLVYASSSSVYGSNKKVP